MGPLCTTDPSFSLVSNVGDGAGMLAISDVGGGQWLLLRRRGSFRSHRLVSMTAIACGKVIENPLRAADSCGYAFATAWSVVMIAFLLWRLWLCSSVSPATSSYAGAIR